MTGTLGSIRRDCNALKVAAIVVASGGCVGMQPGMPGKVSTFDSPLETPFGIVLFVNPVNCELTATDAARLNAVNEHPKVDVHVIFITFGADDSLSSTSAASDLGLTVQASNGELPEWISAVPGNGSPPIAIVVRSGHRRCADEV